MTDLQALALAKSIRLAAWVLGWSLVLLGLMIWQPWASPTYEEVKTAPNSIATKSCVTYKNSITCQW